MNLEILGIKEIPLIKKGDSLANLIIKAMNQSGLDIRDGDILVVAETAIAKSVGNIIKLQDITPSTKAKNLSKKIGKEPELIEAIIRESNEIIKIGPDFIISETKHGFICANAGIDESNVKKGLATPIPEDPDKSANNIMNNVESVTGRKIAVIISDTQGRAFREGAVGVAIGIAGMEPLWDRSGETDLYDRELKTTTIAVADELASAASIVMGQANEGIPVVLIRGVEYLQHLKNEYANIKQLIRPKENDVFR